MFKHATTLGTSALVLFANACGDDRPSNPADTTQADVVVPCTGEAVTPSELTITWDDAVADDGARAFVNFPNAPERFVRTPTLALGAPRPGSSLEGFDIQTIERLDAAGAVIDTKTTCGNATRQDGAAREDCASVVVPWSLNARPGDTLRVTIGWSSSLTESCFTPPAEPVVVDLVVPPDTLARPDATTRAVAAAESSDGTLWLGLLGHGLVGVAPDGTWTAYDAVPSVEPYSATERRPQTPLLFTIADAGDGAIWIGGATTGVSWFHPGSDLDSRDDDSWAHMQPVTDDEDPLKELAETTIAVATDGDEGLWIASLSGLHHYDLNAPTDAMTTVAGGAFLSVATDDKAVAWAGRSIEPAILSSWNPDGADPYPEAALLAVARNDVGVATVTPWNLGTTAVTAVATSGDTIFVGTPAGLLRIDRTDPEASPVAVAASEVGALAITALAVDPRGLWVAARSTCAANIGRLVLIDRDDGSIVEDASNAGFGTRDFNGLTRLADGRLFVSTVVPRTPLGKFTGNDCQEPPLNAYVKSDAFLFDPASEAAPAPIAP